MLKFIFASVFTAAALFAGIAPVHAEGERFVLISHAPDSDSWWNTIRNAIRVAGEQMNVEVKYSNPPTGDLAVMARLVEEAVASNPDGIILSIADYDVLKEPIMSAVERDIPVITINSGTKRQSTELGALMHIGQPEYDAGFGAGNRARISGVTSFLCVNHYANNPASIERCKGYADALDIKLSDQMIDTGLDPAEVKSKVLAYLEAHPETNGILALGPNSADPTIAALEENSKAGRIHFGTFDLSPKIAKAIRDGVVSFAIDQQPFLQGYLPVVFLTNLTRYGVLPSGHMNSGPGFVTKENIELVEKYAGVYR